MCRTILCAIVCTLLAACDTPFTPEGLAGTYTLRTIDGIPLPYAETGDGVTVTIIAGSFTLTETSTYTVSVSVSITEGGSTETFTNTGSGTYTLTEPQTIWFHDSGGITHSGTIEGRRLTLGSEVGVRVYER